MVVKVMRKDVQDASLVRHELELELALLRRYAGVCLLVSGRNGC